jgi:hypothetical protein
MANLGVHLAQQGRLADAIDWTGRAWRAGNITAGFNLGTFYSQAGDTHEPISCGPRPPNSATRTR